MGEVRINFSCTIIIFHSIETLSVTKQTTLAFFVYLEMEDRM